MTKLSTKFIFSKRFILAVGVSAIAFYAFLALGDIKWGKVKLQNESVITVNGTSRSTVKNEVASFTASVRVNNADKAMAIDGMNERAAVLVETVKSFGVNAGDIKTTNMNIYQDIETYYENGASKNRTGNWNAISSIEIKLRDGSKASALATLLGNLETSDVYGPNFMVDNSTLDQAELMVDALKDARAKAEVVAASEGKKLGDVVKIVEGNDYNPTPVMFDRGMGGGGGGFEPGTSDIVKNVTVTYSLN